MTASSSCKLLVTFTSPFARKCRIALAELRLTSHVSLTPVNPWTDNALRTLNPLSKVPTLVRPDGTTIYDSRVILEYLDGLAPKPLLPASGEPRWRALRLQAMADDACAAAGRLYLALQDPASLDVAASSKLRLRTAVYATLDQLETEDLNATSWDLGDMCAAIMPSYYSFRFPDDDWRSQRPRLARFVEEMEQHPSFAANKFEINPS